MRYLYLATIASSLFISACAKTAPSAPDLSDNTIDTAAAQRIEADVRFLADDLLEGRETGARGYDLASLYVASRFQALGLEPAGDDGSYFQDVPLLSAQRVKEGALFTINRDGQNAALEFEAEYLPGINFDQDQYLITAPLVFVGQGVVAPELDHDDFAGVDVTGKIAVILANAPAHFGHDERAFYSNGSEKNKAMVERGAVGVIYVGDPEREVSRPWARGAANWPRGSMRLRDAEGKPVDSFPSLIANASISAAAAEKLFAGSAHSADEVFAMLKVGKLKAFDLPGTVTLAAQTKTQISQSRNVIAKLRGSDSALSGEHAVFTAHLDHIGTGAPINGDGIYNGALDNALGMAMVLEVAKQMQQHKMRRSILFIGLTGEEKGLLGSQYFATNPTVPKAGLIANINIDMPVVLTPQNDAMAIGVEHSSLKAIVESAAKTTGVSVTADPFPEEVFFVRSDQFAFIREGIPALSMDGGLHSLQEGVNGTDELRKFLSTHYHQPSDQVDLPIDYPSAARLSRFNAAIGLGVVNAQEKPKWNVGDFFGQRFAPNAN